MICESVTISTELSDHSRAVTITSVLTVIDHLREKHQHLPLKINSTVWSSRFSGQFRSQFVFKLLASINSSLNITWCFNDRHQGKTPKDGIGGTLKKLCLLWCNVWEIHNWHIKTIYEICRQNSQRNNFLSLSAEDVLIEPDDIKDSPRIKNKFQIHMVKRFFDEWNNVHWK